MKKSANKVKYFLLLFPVWVLIAYCAVVFLVCGFSGHTATFWVSVGFEMLSLVLIEYMILTFSSDMNIARDWVFGMPIIRHITFYAVTALVASTLFLIFETSVHEGITLGVLLFLTLLFLAFSASCILNVKKISDVKDSIAANSSFSQDIIHQILMLATYCVDREAKKALNELYEKVKFCEPLGCEATASVEENIFRMVSGIKNAESSDIVAITQKLSQLFDERDHICRTHNNT